jgi:type II secretory pathway component PulL
MEVLIKPLSLLVSVAIFLVLVLVIFEGARLARLERKIDSLAKNSQEFIKLGLFHFKTKRKKENEQ